MSNKSTFFLSIALFFLSAQLMAEIRPQMQAVSPNLSSFTAERTQSNLEFWKKQNDAAFYTHPEFGILPDNAPCTDCVEDLSKRTASERFFLDMNEPGKFYQQNAFGDLHVYDEGNWVTIDHRIKKYSKGVYQNAFPHNAAGVKVLADKTFMHTPEGAFQFNQWELQVVRADDADEFIKPDWSNYTVGDDGILLQNFFPGIDAEFNFFRGSVKTKFSMHENKFGSFDYLVFTDTYESETDYSLKLSFQGDVSKERGVGFLNLFQENNLIAEISEGVAFPLTDSREHLIKLEYQIKENQLKMLVPFDWIEAHIHEHVLVIDPLVSGSNSLAQAAITGSLYNASCDFTNSCDHNLTVSAPANATFEDVTWSFNYVATGSCWLEDGALRVSTGGCISPSQTGFYWFCNTIGTGTCTGDNISIFNDLGSCLPSPSCNNQDVDFTMHFYRTCWGATGCNNTCIGAGSPWTMTIVGRLVDHPAPIASSAGSSVCSGENVTLTAEGSFGVPPYDYVWQPGNLNGQSVNVTPESTTQYIVMVTDACGNTADQDITINVAGPEVPEITSNLPICEGDDLVLSAVSAGASSFSWTGPNGFTGTGTQVTIANAQPQINSGTYSVTTTGSGCTTAPATIEVEIQTEPDIQSVDITDLTCGLENGAISINVDGDPVQFEYSIDNGNNFQTSGLFENLQEGSYQIVVTDTAGCIATTDVTLTTLPEPEFDTIIVMNESCAGFSDGSIEIVITGGELPIEYSIDNGSTFNSNPIFSDLSSGVYEIVVEDANNCQISAQIEIIQPPSISIDQILTEDASCNQNNGSLEIVASGGQGSLQYSIDGGNQFESNTAFTGLGEGLYQIVVMDDQSCTIIDSVQITTSGLPEIDSVFTLDLSCFESDDGTIEVFASGDEPPFSYSIDGGNNFSSQSSFSQLTEGVYDIVVEDQFGCQSAVLQVNINTPDALEISEILIADSDCNADNGVVEVQVAGGTMPYSFSIDNGSTFQSASDFSDLEPGNYQIIVEDDAGCTVSGSAEIMMVNEVVINQISVVEPSCNASDGEIQVDAAGGSGILSYDLNDGFGAQPQSVFTQIGVGTYEITVTDENGCTATEFVEVIEEGSDLTVSVNVQDVLCAGQSNGTATVEILTGSNPPFIYVWSTGDTTTGSLVNLTSGSYTVTVFDAFQCSASSSFSVDEPEPLSFSLGDDQTICTGESTLIDAGPGFSYLWSNGTTGQSILVTEPGIYGVNVTDSDGCVASDSILVSLSELSLSLSNDTSIQLNQTVQLETELLGDISGGLYTWQPAQYLSCTDCSSPIAAPFETTTYTVAYTNGAGCSVSGNVTIEVIPFEYYFYVPNAFSPNDDGVNDTFFPIFTGVEQFSMRIWNRWGELIFECQNVSDECVWDGTLNGDKLPQQVYVWEAVVEYKGIRVERYKGSVVLVQ